MPKCILSGQVKSTFTQEQADDRYLQLTGGTMTGALKYPETSVFEIANVSANSGGKLQLTYVGDIHSAGINVGNINVFKAEKMDDEEAPTLALKYVVTPTNDTDAANKAYVDSKRPIGRTVTLSSSGWSSNSQTVTVQGVNANSTGQIIDWGAHDQTSYTALASAQLFISASTSPNQLVFTALGEVPSSDVQVDIRIQEGQGV